MERRNHGVAKLFALTATVLLGLPLLSPAQGTLGPDGNYYECVGFSGSDSSWAGAYAEAQTRTLNVNGTVLYGRLASITSLQLYNLENSLVQSAWGSWAIGWTGDYANNGVLYTDSGAPISDTSWVTWGSPNLSSTVGQAGTWGITTSGSGYGYNWTARPSSYNGVGGYVVEFAVPEPAPLGLAVTAGLGLMLGRRRRQCAAPAVNDKALL